MTSNPKPITVEVGQAWRDRDARSIGSGEFVIRDLFRDDKGFLVARVWRTDSKVYRRIKVRRLLTGPYTYIGRER